MQPFVKESGRAAALDRVNVDTDQICPAEFLKRIERTGFGKFLFHSWRFLKDGSPNPAFELNAPQYQEAIILIAGKNFGCGSSREHAVWALADYGFRAIISSSFAEIFHKNCFENGLCPVLLPEEQVAVFMERAKSTPGYQLTVDLQQCVVNDSQGTSFPFVMHREPETHSFRRFCLLNGLDEVGLTLQHEDKIQLYEAKRPSLGYVSFG